MKKKIFFVSTILLFLVLAIFLSQRGRNPIPGKQMIWVGEDRLTVEVARSDAEIGLGLGERNELGSDGMLFVMPDRGIPTFWMKGMRFDLDFVWIDGTKVVDITENVSAQRGASEQELRLYRPKSVVTHVLEMNAGEVKKRGIGIGDKVSY